MVNPYIRRAKNSFRRLKFSTRFALFPIVLSILIACFVSSNTLSPSLSIEPRYTPLPNDADHSPSWGIKTYVGMKEGRALKSPKPAYAKVGEHDSNFNAFGSPPPTVTHLTISPSSVNVKNHHEDHSLAKGSKKTISHGHHSSHHHHHDSVSVIPHTKDNIKPETAAKQAKVDIGASKVISSPHPHKISHPHVDHGHPRFQFNEKEFTGLPDTKLLLDKEFTSFKPLRSRTTDVRLISLRNVCYCTQRNKFLVPRVSKDKKTKFPGYLYRYGSSFSVSWKRKKNILASMDQKVVQVDGTTIVWRGRSIHSYTNHLQSSLIPIRSLLDVLKKTGYNDKVRIAAESFTPSAQQEEAVRKAYDYFLGDVPEENRIEFARLRPRLLCFERVLALGSEYEGHAKSVETYENVKGLIEKREGSTLQGKLARTCKDVGTTKKTIWVLERQDQNTHAGTISNSPEVREAIHHELVRAHMDDKVNIEFIQSPSIPCPKGTKRAGCFETNCSGEGDTKTLGETEVCRHHPDILSEVQVFNKMTFLITVTGQANEGVMYMPRGSQVIEVLPYGILDHSFESLANDAQLKHSRLENRSYKQTEWFMFDRFGDVARNLHSCWGDLECQQFRRTRATHIDVHHLKLLVRKALVDWKKSCEVGV
ncbi:unnamed protein product [Agarophyton chilense]